jgi:hypothetical protein
MFLGAETGRGDVRENRKTAASRLPIFALQIGHAKYRCKIFDTYL